MRYWSLLFALAAVFCVGAFAYAPFAADWWLPNPPRATTTTSVSTFGREIDSLFLIILWITGIVFIGTQVVLVWAPGSTSIGRRPASATSTSTAASGWR